VEDINGIHSDSVRRIAYLEISKYLGNQLLRDVDWTSMASSVEVRTPFVDATLFEQIGKIAAKYGWPTKNDLVRGIGSLPEAIRVRGKTGFGLPYFDPRAGHDEGLREPPQRRWAREVYRTFRRRARTRPYGVA
jgi:asparagine synthase (glutamine-hydrolysing)